MENYSCNLCKNIKQSKDIQTYDCDHCICRKCLKFQIMKNLEELIENNFYSREMNIICSICNKGQFKISKEKIKELLQEKIVNNIPLCGMHKKEAEFYCISCKWKMCKICLENHNSIKTSTPHSIVNASEYNLQTNQNVCHKHNNKPLIFQCITCEEPICEACQFLTHKEHTLENIDEYYTKLKEKLSTEEFKSKFEEKMKLIDQKENEHINLIETAANTQIEELNSLINELTNLKALFLKETQKGKGN